MRLTRSYSRPMTSLESRCMNGHCLAGVAVDAVFDSVSVATTFKEKLKDAGVIFCPFSEAVRDYPELVRKYLGTVVPYRDNFFRNAEFGRFQRRFVCLHTERRALSDGTVNILPHKRGQYRSVRTYADYCR